MYSSLKTTKPYTPDISLTAEGGLSTDLYAKLAEIEGVKHAYGRMLGHVAVAFDASRLTEAYKTEMGGVKTRADGFFDPPEDSWLISYDKNQLGWAKTDLVKGTLSEEELNAKDGIVAVANVTRKGVTKHMADLRLNDKVYIDTHSGTKTYTVMAILRVIPFNDSKLDLTAFITTEEQFAEITGQSTYQAIDLQIEDKEQEKTIAEIKKVIGEDVTFLDIRQRNTEINQTFLTMAVFVYGFVAVIALISLLNLIGTMNTSISSRTKYFGVLRAVGMSGDQLFKMVAAEAAVYSVVGCVGGCALGVLLQKGLIEGFLTAITMTWKFPLAEVVCSAVATFVIAGLSLVSPIRRIRSTGISEVIGSL
jgi:putative ABC transport system permease protein